jgi:3-oxoacyl-[acyl-carrier-protein] synthase III
MVEKIRSAYRLPTETTKESLKTLENCGNLAGASLPFILERILRGGSLNTGEKILLLGFGWGFSASASLLKF